MTIAPGRGLGRRRARRLLIACAGAAALTFSSLACGDAVSAQPAASHPRHLRLSVDPLAGSRLYVAANSPAATQAAMWRTDGQVRAAETIEAIARRPTFTWLTGGRQPAAAVVRSLVDAATRVNAVSEFVLYDIPDRDCDGYSSGGASTPAAYRAWVSTVVRALGQHPAIVILEPDAIDQGAKGCLDSAQASERFRLLADAVRALRRDPRAHVYIDAGNATWLAPATVAGPLREADVAAAAGFSLNVANFQTTAASVRYGDLLSRGLHGAHFVIDTSRNGAGPPPAAPGVHAWCNPPGRALGTAPRTRTGLRDVDAYLWVKYPGGSDGACAPGDPPAGVWWPGYALGLAQRARARARR